MARDDSWKVQANNLLRELDRYGLLPQHDVIGSDRIQGTTPESPEERLDLIRDLNLWLQKLLPAQARKVVGRPVTRTRFDDRSQAAYAQARQSADGWDEPEPDLVLNHHSRWQVHGVAEFDLVESLWLTPDGLRLIATSFEIQVGKRRLLGRERAPFTIYFDGPNGWVLPEEVGPGGSEITEENLALHRVALGRRALHCEVFGQPHLDGLSRLIAHQRVIETFGAEVVGRPATPTDSRPARGQAEAALAEIAAARRERSRPAGAVARTGPSRDGVADDEWAELDPRHFFPNYGGLQGAKRADRDHIIEEKSLRMTHLVRASLSDYFAGSPESVANGWGILSEEFDLPGEAEVALEGFFTELESNLRAGRSGSRLNVRRFAQITRPKESNSEQSPIGIAVRDFAHYLLTEETAQPQPIDAIQLMPPNDMDGLADFLHMLTDLRPCAIAVSDDREVIQLETNCGPVQIVLPAFDSEEFRDIDTRPCGTYSDIPGLLVHTRPVRESVVVFENPLTAVSVNAAVAERTRRRGRGIDALNTPLGHEVPPGARPRTDHDLLTSLGVITPLTPETPDTPERPAAPEPLSSHKSTPPLPDTPDGPGAGKGIDPGAER